MSDKWGSRKKKRNRYWGESRISEATGEVLYSDVSSFHVISLNQIRQGIKGEILNISGTLGTLSTPRSPLPPIGGVARAPPLSGSHTYIPTDNP